MSIAHPTLIALVAACALASGQSSASCLDSLAAHRAQIETDYLKSKDSPFDQEMRARFAGFAYFAGNAAYCVESAFERTSGDKTFQMATFNGKTLPFRRYGVFHFQLGGASRSLAAYQRMDLPETERQWVLIPFRDETNGHETYGGGRYLQVDLPIGSATTLDFNRAFNPLCAYDSKFTCPIPPADNALKVSIPAGEKSDGGSH
jgi:uncharacterized protein